MVVCQNNDIGLIDLYYYLLIISWYKTKICCYIGFGDSRIRFIYSTFNVTFKRCSQKCSPKCGHCFKYGFVKLLIITGTSINIIPVNYPCFSRTIHHDSIIFWIIHLTVNLNISQITWWLITIINYLSCMY